MNFVPYAYAAIAFSARLVDVINKLHVNYTPQLGPHNNSMLIAR